MNSTIIKCSRSDCATSLNNAVWSNDFARGTTVNDGDLITVRNCFINSNLSSLDNIQISQRTSLYLTFGYYDVNWTSVNKSNATEDIDYDFYIGYIDNLGTVATMQSLTFRGIYNGPTISPLICKIEYKTNDGKLHTIIYDPTNPDPNAPHAQFPEPPEGQGHESTLNLVLNIPNVIISSLAISDLEIDEKFMGADWENPGQFGFSLNTGSIEVVINPGEYTRDGLAKEITTQLQLSPPMYQDIRADTGNDLLRRTDFFNNHIPCEDDIFGLNFLKEVDLAGNYNSLDAVRLTGLDFDVDVTVYWVETDNDGTKTKFKKATKVDESPQGIVTVGNIATIFFADDVFNPNTNVSNIYIEVNKATNLSFMRVGSDPRNAQTKQYTYTIPSYYGSSENVLEYDDDRGIFTWSYIHMPYFSGNPPTISIEQIKNTDPNNQEANGKFYTITQQSGIFFINLEPATFWESLGFNLEGLIVPVQPNLSINRNDLLDRITRGFSSLSSLMPLGNRLISGNQNQPISTTDTLTLDANIIDDTNDTEGYYLVAVSVNNNDFNVTDGNYKNVSAIVGKYNQIKDYINAYSDSSINYIHHGDPFDISNIDIQILNPKTMQPDDNLGENSTVFLEIFKGGTIPANK